MLEPGGSSPCCKGSGGKLTTTNPDTHRREYDPVNKTGKLFCNLCHHEYVVHNVRTDS